jgi:hypothetical protein
MANKALFLASFVDTAASNAKTIAEASQARSMRKNWPLISVIVSCIFDTFKYSLVLNFDYYVVLLGEIFSIFWFRKKYYIE